MHKIWRFLEWAGIIMSPITIALNYFLNIFSIVQIEKNNVTLFNTILFAIFFVSIISLVYSTHREVENLKKNNKGIKMNPLDDNIIASSKKTVRRLLKQLKIDKSINPRIEAANAIGNIGLLEHVPELEKLLKDPVEEVRSAIINAIEKIHKRYN